LRREYWRRRANGAPADGVHQPGDLINQREKKSFVGEKRANKAKWTPF
jgi:hypothetical protein